MNYQYLDSPVGRLRLVSDGQPLTATNGNPKGPSNANPSLRESGIGQRAYQRDKCQQQNPA